MQKKESYLPLPLPSSEITEKALLASMILDRTAILKAVEKASEDIFYFERHRTIYQCIVELFNKGKNIDLVTLSNLLAEKKQLESIGGHSALAEIISVGCIPANVIQYIETLIEKKLKRDLTRTAYGIISQSTNDTADIFEILEETERSVFSILQKCYIGSYKHIKDIVSENYSFIERIWRSDQNGITGVPTGFYELDDVLGGLQPSEFIVIASRPSMGKTALALSMAKNIILNSKIPVAIFSLEMSAQQLLIRLVSAISRVPHHKIRTGKITYEEFEKIKKTMSLIENYPLFIDDTPSLGLLELRTKCRRLKYEHNIGVVFIDYLQLIRSGFKAESREREISIISASLKQIAKELGVPVVALAQLNRSVEARQNKRPMLSDLRESGSIEQDADVVMMVYRPIMYGIDGASLGIEHIENYSEIIIAKQRNGALKDINLFFIGDYMLFENYSYAATINSSSGTEEFDF